MARFFIEVQHAGDEISCAHVVQVFLSSGSHFLTHADWGCKDGVHCAWLTVDVDNREQARTIVPPAFRSQTRIVALNKVGMEEIEQVLAQHKH